MSGNYNPTLVKYFLTRQRAKAQAVLTVEGLIEKWLSDRTAAKYQVVLKHLQRGAADLLGMPAKRVGEGHAEDFSLYIEGIGIGPDQRKRHLETLKAVWE